MKISNLNNLIKIGSLQLKNWGIIDIIGEKDKVFDLLQGQVTSDVKLLEENECQLSSICNHKGQVMADFIIYCINNSYKFILKDELSDILISELDPINKEIKKLLNEETYIVEILRMGSEKADDISRPIL